jgi:hypothetical protein
MITFDKIRNLLGTDLKISRGPGYEALIIVFCFPE